MMTQAVATEPQRQPLEMNVWVRRPEGNLERPRMKAERAERAVVERVDGRRAADGQQVRSEGTARSDPGGAEGVW